MEDPTTNNHTSNNNNITNINITNNSNNSNSSSSSSSSISSSGRERNSNNSSEPVRSRWTPKPEQILILESIFNSGMVNPPKEETVRIRKLLEKFGAVGDANVFYWFQNRRSRSRRRQRQLQASLAASASNPAPPPVLLGGGDGGFYHEYGNLQLMSSNSNNNKCTSGGNNSVVTSFAPSLFSTAGVEDVFSTFSGQMMSVISPHHHPLQNTTVTTTCSSPTPILCPSDPSNLEFQSGIITVFINGVATQMAEGPVDVKAMFGEEVILVHSSGLPVPFNEYGISFQTLQHGESYFLVPRLA